MILARKIFRTKKGNDRRALRRCCVNVQQATKELQTNFTLTNKHLIGQRLMKCFTYITKQLVHTRAFQKCRSIDKNDGRQKFWYQEKKGNSQVSQVKSRTITTRAIVYIRDLQTDRLLT